MSGNPHYRFVVDFTTKEELSNVDRTDLLEAIKVFVKSKCSEVKQVTNVAIFPPWFKCTGCDYEYLEEEPFYSYEICPKCNVEFGLDDIYAGKDREVFEKEYYKR